MTAHIENANDDKLRELEEYLLGSAVEGPGRVGGDDGTGLWGQGLFRLFVSHTSAYKSEITAFKVSLRARSIDGFVAHKDIEPTKTWEAEIEKALQTCDGLATYLTSDFSASVWTDQEVGYCLARNVAIVPIRIDVNPYGFIAKYQAIDGRGMDSEQLAEEVLLRLIGHERGGPRIASALVHRFANSPSYNSARANLDLIKRIPRAAWSADLYAQVEAAIASNNELSADVGFGRSTVAAEAQKLVAELRAKPR